MSGLVEGPGADHDEPGARHVAQYFFVDVFRQQRADLSEARKNGMLYMMEEGLRLVVRGVTSVDELSRVVK